MITHSVDVGHDASRVMPAPLEISNLTEFELETWPL